MKPVIFIFILVWEVTGAFILPGRCETPFSESPGEQKSENIRWIKSATEHYSPVAWTLLMRYDALPEHLESRATDDMVVTTRKTAGTFQYLEGSSKKELLSAMETNVHELAHGFFSLNVFRYVRDKGMLLDWDMVQGFIYLSPSDSYFISFPKERLFPSKELVNVIPHDLRTFRFEDYINGTTSTQGQGVIGLLDELHAYYLGSKYCFDMYKAYVEAEGSDEAGLFTWVNRSQSSMSAFWEFDFFICEYLLHMKNRYPSDYATLADCQSFVKAYKAVRDAYKTLAEQYESLINSEIRNINESGKARAWIEDGSLWITPGGSNYSQGTPVFSDARGTLEPVLRSDRYKALVEILK